MLEIEKIYIGLVKKIMETFVEKQISPDSFVLVFTHIRNLLLEIGSLDGYKKPTTEEYNERTHYSGVVSEQFMDNDEYYQTFTKYSFYEKDTNGLLLNAEIKLREKTSANLEQLNASL